MACALLTDFRSVLHLTAFFTEASPLTPFESFTKLIKQHEQFKHLCYIEIILYLRITFRHDCFALASAAIALACWRLRSEAREVEPK